jgi:hypothetical protein
VSQLASKNSFGWCSISRVRASVEQFERLVVTAAQWVGWGEQQSLSMHSRGLSLEIVMILNRINGMLVRRTTALSRGVRCSPSCQHGPTERTHALAVFSAAWRLWQRRNNINNTVSAINGGSRDLTVKHLTMPAAKCSSQAKTRRINRDQKYHIVLSPKWDTAGYRRCSDDIDNHDIVTVGIVEYQRWRHSCLGGSRGLAVQH